MRHSYLYRLDPMGTGTEMVESLTSYISRLAIAHCVPVKTLVFEVLAPRLAISMDRSYSRFFKEYAVSINGLGEYATGFSTLLDELTIRKDLSFLTMLGLKDVFDRRGKGLLKSVKVWCPYCFKEQKASGTPLFEPLLWTISPITFCRKHQCELRSFCPSCKMEQPILARDTLIGQCAHCGDELNDPEKYEGTILGSSLDKWQEWLSAMVGNIMIAIQRRQIDPTWDLLQKGVKNAIDVFASGNAKNLDAALGFGRGTLTQWRRGRCRPRFDYFFHFCYRLGLDPISFLSNQGNFEISGISIEKTDSMLQKAPPRIWRTQHQDHASILKELDLLVGTEDYCLSLEKVAENLKVGIGYLRYRFPKQSRKISARYKEGILRRAEETFDRKGQAISATVREFMERGEYPSKERVFRNAPGVSFPDGRNPKLAEIWKATLIESSSSK